MLHEDRHETVDLAFAPVALDLGTRGVVLRVSEEDIQGFTDLPVDRWHLTSKTQSQVCPAWDHRLVQAEGVVGIAVQSRRGGCPEA